MTEQLPLLAITAASIGFIHTILGPDHYVPFVVMAKSGKWSSTKTALITFLCGIGHVGSSVVLGFVGIALGIAVTNLESVESARGNIAAWALIAFGLVYMVWGIRRAIKNKGHHGHLHIGKTTIHTDSASNSDHVHSLHEEKPNLTPWILFTVFVFGPCEPLIPLVMYPAAKGNMAGVALVAGIFSFVTIGTMMATVLALRAGIVLLPLRNLERFMHAIAGGVILLCGISIRFLGL
jgi:sulfite exporter TauE/SafE